MGVTQGGGLMGLGSHRVGVSQGWCLRVGVSRGWGYHRVGVP